MRAFFAYVLTFVFPLVAEQSSLSEALSLVIQPPKFSEGIITLQPLDQIVEIVSPIITDRLQKLTYDRVYATTQFLDYYRACERVNPAISPLEVFKTFQFDPLKPPFHGGPCVSLTLDIYNHLPQELGGYIVAAKLPKRYQQFALPKFCHTAVLIHFQDPIDESDEGFVLLDPSFDFPVPIVLRKNDPKPFVCDMGEKGIWEFTLNQDKIICEIYNKQRSTSVYDEEDWRMIYRTDQLLNPIESSAAPMILADRRLSFLTRSREGQSLAHLNIEMNKKRIVWDAEGIFFEPISFAKFVGERWMFPESFSSALRLSKFDLFFKISTVIENKAILDDLYASYLSLILELEDFSITGVIDRKETEAIIANLQ